MWKRSRKDGCNLEKVKSDEVLFLKLASLHECSKVPL